MSSVSRSIRFVALNVLALGCFASLVAAAPYNESVNGDLSGVPATPTAWTLEAGANPLSGHAGLNSTTFEYDYDLVAVTIPAGMQLDSIELTNYLNVDPFGFGFIGLQAGSPWLDTVGPSVNGGFLMGYTHIEPVMEGTDLLALIQERSGDAPFSIPLGPGTYSFLIQDIELSFDYEMVFNVSGVPEPSSAALLAIGAAVTLRWRRRRG